MPRNLKSPPLSDISEPLRDLLAQAALLHHPSRPDQMTKIWLSENLWWWHHCHANPEEQVQERLRQAYGLDDFTIDFLHVMITRCQSKAAFLYELLIRQFFPESVTMSWLCLPPEFRTLFIDLFPLENPAAPGVALTSPNSPPERHMTDACNFRFNLLHSDEELAKEFLCFWIHPQRKEKGIPRPKPNERKHNRGMSWRPIEFFDLQRFEIKSLSASERSQLSKARRNALKEAMQFATFKESLINPPITAD